MDFQVINRVKRSARHVFPKLDILIITKKVSEYDQEIAQLHIADKPMAP